MSLGDLGTMKKRIPLYGHLWVYASNYPPNWDCTPILEQVFADFQYAGIEGVELMEIQLRHEDAVSRIGPWTERYQVGVSGSSYGVGRNMWDKGEHGAIQKDLQTIIPRLSDLGGSTFGISVGAKPQTLKTSAELDAQAKMLDFTRKLCDKNGIQANLHNHTYEVENDLYDLKQTLMRLPDFPLGPDINWLIRAEVDPMAFINAYGKQIVYLHLRDQYKSGEWTEYVGQGDTDFKAIATALKSQNFAGKAAIELAFPNDFKPQQELKESWKLSREFVQRSFDWT